MSSIAKIVEIYRKRQQSDGLVRICVVKVKDYNNASRNTSGHVTRRAQQWEFVEDDHTSPAYKHRPERRAIHIVVANPLLRRWRLAPSNEALSSLRRCPSSDIPAVIVNDTWEKPRRLGRGKSMCG